MNERIKQLAKQTGYIWHASGDPQIYEFTPEKLEKFAELIVKECTRSIENTIETDCITDGEKMGCEFAILDLLKHFGVEE